jgi:hypothetical protein
MCLHGRKVVKMNISARTLFIGIVVVYLLLWAYILLTTEFPGQSSELLDSHTYVLQRPTLTSGSLEEQLNYIQPRFTPMASHFLTPSEWEPEPLQVEKVQHFNGVDLANVQKIKLRQIWLPFLFWAEEESPSESEESFLPKIPKQELCIQMDRLDGPPSRFLPRCEQQDLWRR